MKKILVSLCSLFVICLSAISCVSMDFSDIALNMIDDGGESVVKSVNAIKRAATDITPEEEYYLGRSTSAIIIEKNGGLYNNTEKTKYVNKICGALVMYSEKPYLYKGYSVGILNSQDLNAISTPGGHIFITKGMYDIADSEDALAAIIAHEIAHIQLNHASDVIKMSRTMEAVTATVDAVDKMTRSREELEEEEWVNALSLAYVEKILTDGFSSEQEYEADAYALKLLVDAGYDPKTMADALVALKMNQNGKTTFDKTHPRPNDRLEKVNAKLKAEPFVSCKANKEERIERFKKYR